MEARHYSDRAAIAANQNIKEKEYWLEQLSGEPVKSFFPYDFDGMKAAEQVDRSRAVESVRLPDDLVRKLEKVSSGIDIKLHMVLTAGLVLLLNKYTGTNDILTGAPVLRQEQEAEFINRILIFRSRIAKDMSFKELLLQVRGAIIAASENQNFPLEVLPGLLNIPHSGNGFPLFDVVLLLENIHDRNYLDGITFNILFSFLRSAGSITGALEYDNRLYKKETIQGIINRFAILLSKVLDNMEIPLSSVGMLSQEERTKILVDFNRTETEYPEEKTLHELFAEQVDRTPDRVALLSHIDADVAPEPTCSLTYRELDCAAGRLADLLIEKGVGGGIVAIMAGPSFEMMTGMWGVLKAGGAYLPIDPGSPAGRVRFMLADSGVNLLLTTNGCDNSAGTYKNLQVERIFIEETGNSAAPGVRVGAGLAPARDSSNTDGQPQGRPLQSSTTGSPGDLAYVIYTSGTTGFPKGVLVEHRNVVAYLFAFYREFAITERDTVLQQSTFTFDVFVEEVYPVLLRGGKLAIPARSEVLSIDLLSAFIRKHKVNVIDCTPQLLRELDKVTGLGCVETVISGGDVLKKEYIEHFMQSSCAVYNTYGPTETTVCASYYRCIPPLQKNVPIGKPIANYKIFILDRNGLPQPAGIAGELCVSGAGVTRGYLNRPELTAEKFASGGPPFCKKVGPKTFDEGQEPRPVGAAYMRPNSDVGARRAVPSGGPCVPPLMRPKPLEGARAACYKTGDLARWLPGGNIEFLGRIDNQVKIRGYRIELGEIEHKLRQHAGIEEAVVVEKTEKSGDKYLCGYFVSEKDPDPAELRDYLNRRLPDYMVPWFYTRLEKIPLTPNGKIDLKALPEPQAAGEKAYAAPRNEMEKELVEIWGRVLAVDKEVIGIDANFFDLGGNSLKAIVISSKIQKAFSAKVMLEDIFELQTIRKLVEIIGGAALEEYAVIEPVETKEYYRLSSAQKRLYVMQQMEPDSSGYNMPFNVVLAGEPDERRLSKTFEKLLARHEMLRTSFETIAGEPVQRIHRPGLQEFDIEFFDCDEEKAREFVRDFVRPFDLSKAPLLRAALVRVREAGHAVLVMDMHHIVSDGISHQVLHRDFLYLYEGAVLPALMTRYKDFSEWQNSKEERQKLIQQEDFWLNELSGELPVLAIETDFPRPSEQSFAGAAETFGIDKETTAALRTLARDEEATLQILLLAIFNVLLHKISGQEDIIAGTSVTGRRHASLEAVVGMFANVLSLRNFPAGEKSFLEFLREVRKNSLAAYENQDVQFDELVGKILTHRAAGRNPLFDVMFEVQEFSAAGREKPAADEEENRAAELAPYVIGKKTTKIELDWLGQTAGDGLVFTVDYCTDLYKQETVVKMIDRFKEVLHRVLEDRSVLLKDIVLSHDYREAAATISSVDDGDFQF